MPALPIGDCIKFGWETFKKRPWILIGALLLVGLVYAIPGILTPHPEVVEGQPPPPPTTFGHRHGPGQLRRRAYSPAWA